MSARRWALVALGLAILACAFAATPAPSRISQGVPYEVTFRSVAGPRWVDRAAQAWAESNFNPQARSAVGAVGLTQFMPTTWAWAQDQGWVARGASPEDPSAAIHGQHAYMLWLEARCGGSLDPALGSYNAGLGSIRKAQRLAATLGIDDPSGSAWLKVLDRVTGPQNAAQTRGYITRNRAFRAAIRQREGMPIQE